VCGQLMERRVNATLLLRKQVCSRNTLDVQQEYAIEEGLGSRRPTRPDCAG
jgi:hypothetical protein